MPIKLVDSPPTVEELIHNLRYADLALEEAKKAKEAASKALQDHLLATQFKSKTVSASWDPSKSLRAVYVANNRITINEEGLRKAIGAAAFKKVSITKVDRSLLEDAISQNELDPQIVKQFIKVDSHPYIRVSEIVTPEETDEPTS